jgi:hypothetical protein
VATFKLSYSFDNYIKTLLKKRCPCYIGADPTEADGGIPRLKFLPKWGYKGINDEVFNTYINAETRKQPCLRKIFLSDKYIK